MAVKVAELAEAQVRSVIDSWAKTIRAKDAAGVVSQLARDIVQFDLAPPLRVVGVDSAGQQAWFATWRDEIGFEITNLHVTASDNIAFCDALVHLTGSRTDGSETDLWFRNTLCLRKTAGTWKIAHVHESVPMHMDGSAKAAVDLEP